MRRLLLGLLFFILSFSLVTAYNQNEYPPISPENVMNLQEVAVLGNGAMNEALAWSPDNSLFAVAGTNGFYLYEDLNSAPEFIELCNVQSLLFANSQMIFLSDGLRLRAFDLTNRSVSYALEGMSPLAISHDGEMLAYEVDFGVRVLEIETGEVLHDFSYEGILEREAVEEYYHISRSYRFAQFSPNDSILSIRWITSIPGTDSWYPATGSDELELSGTEFENYLYEGADRLGVDNDGRSFVLRENRLGSTILEGLNNYGVNDSVEFKVYGRMFAAPFWTAENRVVTGLWNMDTGELLQEFPSAGALVFSPNGEALAIGKNIYSVDSGELLHRLQADEFLMLTKSQKVLHFAADDSLRLMDAERLEEIAILPVMRHDMYNFEANEDNLLTLSQTLGLGIRVDLATGQEITRYQSSLPQIMSDAFVHTSPNGLYLLNADHDVRRSISTLWDNETGEVLPLPPEFVLLKPYFHPDSRLYAWDKNRQAVVFYDIASETVIKEFPVENSYIDERVPNRVGISSQGQYILISNEEETILWSSETMQVIWTIEDPLSLTRFSPDEQYLAYISSIAGTANVLKLDTMNNLNLGEFDFVGTMDFLPNEIVRISGDFEPFFFSVLTGEGISAPESMPQPFLQVNGLNIFNAATEADDGAVFQIEATNGQVLYRLMLHHYYRNFSTDSNGTRFYISYTDGRVGIWAVPE